MGARFADLRVGTKIIATVAVVAVIMLVIGGLAWSRMGSLDDRIQGIKSTNIARLNNLVAVRGGLADAYRGLFVYKASQPAAQPAAEEEAKAGQAAVDEAWAAYIATPDPSAAWKNNVQTFSENWTPYKALVNVLILGDPAPSDGSVPTDPQAQSAAWLAAEQKMNDALDTLTALERSQAGAASADAHEEADAAKTLIAALIVAGLIIAL
ncbi:MCP four helix bundle domain-containing protein, partial [Cryptosporangium aurantiacum]